MTLCRIDKVNTMTTNEFKSLEKEFILDEDIEHKELDTLIRRMLKFCKVDKKGFVIIPNAKKLIVLDRILLVLGARNLANKLQIVIGQESTIKKEVTIDELENILKEKREVILARIKDLRDNGSIETPEKGVYTAAIHAVKSLLEKIENE